MVHRADPVCEAVSTLLLGHRGARAIVSTPENTLASFDLCLQHGCDGFEFDVRRTSDGVPVVCHDATFRGLRIAQTLERDLAPWQLQGFLPTLEQVLSRYALLCFLDVEIKDPGIEPQIVDLLRRYTPVKGYVVTSFRPDILLRLRLMDSAVPLGLIWEESISEERSTEWRSLPVAWALPKHSLLDGVLAAELLAAGKRIGTWTVNDPSEMKRLATLGAEILISDDTAGLANTFAVG
jgi:glycerophosphoryl diester phosphodiesterase